MLKLVVSHSLGLGFPQLDQFSEHFSHLPQTHKLVVVTATLFTRGKSCENHCLTCSKLVETAGNTSPTLRSTSTSPTNRYAFRLASTPCKVSCTRLEDITRQQRLDRAGKVIAMFSHRTCIPRPLLEARLSCLRGLLVLHAYAGKWWQFLRQILPSLWSPCKAQPSIHQEIRRRASLT